MVFLYRVQPRIEDTYSSTPSTVDIIAAIMTTRNTAAMNLGKMVLT